MEEDAENIMAPAALEAGERWRDPRILFVPLVLLAVAALLRVTFNPVFYADEIEHAHVTWVLGHGVLPYRDIHQIHLPLLWISVSPILSLLPESIGSLLALRVLCLGALAGACVAGVLCLRELVVSPLRSQLLCVVLVAVGMAAQLEYNRYRPDPFMAMLVAWSLLAVLRLRRDPVRYAFLAGVALGLAASFSTKMVSMCLMVPLLCVFEALRVRDWRPLLIGLPNLAGFIVGVIPAGLWLAYHGIAADFVEWTVVHNSEMVRLSNTLFRYLWSAGPSLRVFAALALIGAAVAFLQMLRVPALAWSPRVGLLIALVLAWGVRAIEANHFDYNLQVMVIPVAIASALALGALLEVKFRLTALAVMVAALGVFLYRPLIGEGVHMKAAGVQLEGAALAEMIRRTREPGATCIGFAPYHPVFCRGASRLYLSWDLWFLEQMWMTPAGKKPYKEMWAPALRAAHATRPTLIVDSGLWERARKRKAITRGELARFRRLLETEYEPIELGRFTAWVRRAPAGA